MESLQPLTERESAESLVASPSVKPAVVGAPPVAEVTLIRAQNRRQPIDVAELWRYRELLWFLAVRDIKVRYKQTVLGIAWAVLQPLFTMIVFSIFFGRLANMPSDEVEYPLFVMCALIPWQLFAYSLTQASNSVVNEQRLITKVYFPRIIIPLAAVLSGLVDFAIAFLLLIVMMAWYGRVPGWQVVTIPVFVLFAVAAALAVGLWLAALNVKYRDFRYTIPFLTQFWMFATPVAYPSSIVPEAWRPLYGLNPLTGVVEGFRWALLGTPTGPGLPMAVSAATVVILLIGGLYYFRRVERSFADIV